MTVSLVTSGSKAGQAKLFLPENSPFSRKGWQVNDSLGVFMWLCTRLLWVWPVWLPTSSTDAAWWQLSVKPEFYQNFELRARLSYFSDMDPAPCGLDSG